jgi:hypothetical protein
VKTREIKAVVNRIIKKHGAVIDLRKNPNIIVDLMRELAADIAGGNPCGGVPPTPGPPGPSKAGHPVTNDDLMRTLLRSSRDINAIRTSLTALTKQRF